MNNSYKKSLKYTLPALLLAVLIAFSGCSLIKGGKVIDGSAESSVSGTQSVEVPESGEGSAELGIGDTSADESISDITSQIISETSQQISTLTPEETATTAAPSLTQSSSSAAESSSAVKPSASETTVHTRRSTTARAETSASEKADASSSAKSATSSGNGESGKSDGTFDGRFYYSRLSSSQKEIYTKAYKAVKTGSTTFNYVAASDDIKSDLTAAVYAFVYDFPEYCSLRTAVNWQYSGRDVTATVGTWSFSSDPKGGSYADDLRAKVNQIASNARSYNSVYSRVKYIHDYLCVNIRYDKGAYYKGNNTNLLTRSEQMSSTAYGALVNGKALCGGYSAAFVMIMRELGYECAYISGTAKGNHAWNIFKANGNYYYIDITWDDGADSEDEYIRYDYFCLTSEEMGKTHTPDGAYKYPSATSNDLNFYVHNGYILDSYSSEAARDIIAAQKSNNFIYIKFTNKDAYNQANSRYGGIFDEITRATGRRLIKYYHDDSLYTLVFET